jgi:hypothetical protein
MIAENTANQFFVSAMSPSDCVRCCSLTPTIALFQPVDVIHVTPQKTKNSPKDWQREYSGRYRVLQRIAQHHQPIGGLSSEHGRSAGKYDNDAKIWYVEHSDLFGVQADTTFDELGRNRQRKPYWRYRDRNYRSCFNPQ